MERTFRDKKGNQITTTLTDQEGIQLCNRLDNAFVRKLVAKYNASIRSTQDGRPWTLSEAQWYWIFKFAHEGDQPLPSGTNGEFKKIIDFFKKAQSAGFFRIKLKVPAKPDGLPIRVHLSYASGATSSYPHSINVVDGTGPRQLWFGRIDTSGTFHKSNLCTDDILSILRQFRDDPAAVARTHGYLNGNCCFCHTPLTGISAEVGYGPVCAQTFSLPWINAPTTDDIPSYEEPTPPLFDDPNLQAEYDRLVIKGKESKTTKK